MKMAGKVWVSFLCSSSPVASTAIQHSFLSASRKLPVGIQLLLEAPSIEHPRHDRHDIYGIICGSMHSAEFRSVEGLYFAAIFLSCVLVST